MSQKPSSSSSSSNGRPSRTGDRLIRRLCANESTLEKALALYESLQDVFAHGALPNVCAYIACEMLGNTDVSWEAASLASTVGPPECLNLWQQVRRHLSKFTPTVSYLSLVRTYDLTAPQSFITVLQTVEDIAGRDSVFINDASRDSVLFAVFTWTGSLLKIENITPEVIETKCDDLASMITMSYEAVKMPRGGTLLNPINEISPPSSRSASSGPGSIVPLKRGAETVTERSPGSKRLNSGTAQNEVHLSPSKPPHQTSHIPVTYSRSLNEIRRHPLPLNSEASSKKSDVAESASGKGVITPPVKPSFVGENPWKRTKTLSPEKDMVTETSQSRMGAHLEPLELEYIGVNRSAGKPSDQQASTSQSARSPDTSPVAIEPGLDAGPPAKRKRGRPNKSSQPIPSSSSSSRSTLVNSSSASSSSTLPSTIVKPTPIVAPTQATQAQLLTHIRKADWAIITHTETFPCPDVILKLKILDLKTRILERDKLPTNPGNPDVLSSASVASATKLDELIQNAREDVVRYVRGGKDDKGNKVGIGEGGYGGDIELKLKVLDLETRVSEWRRIMDGCS
ncbi:unnamed protein product [Somion occarium]|uniref:Uncharacterized protein n=1 Tax=Somion occarium TaxID=3059160 RepID=A0ABP1DA62_9APHY